jgi:hypothetical protein
MQARIKDNRNYNFGDEGDDDFYGGNGGYGNENWQK